MNCYEEAHTSRSMALASQFSGHGYVPNIFSDLAGLPLLEWVPEQADPSLTGY